MNVHEKIAKIRCEVGIEKTGKNKFGNYDYFELNNIYQNCKEKMKEIGLSTIIHSTATFHTLPDGDFKVLTTWYLKVFDVEKPEDNVTYSMNTIMNNGKGMAEPQNAGATRTYMEKYLYGSFLMIDDNSLDPDATNDHSDSTPKKTVVKTTQSKASSNGRLSRDELIAKFKELPEDIQKEHVAKYNEEHGKSITDGAYMTSAYLNKVLGL